MSDWLMISHWNNFLIPPSSFLVILWYTIHLHNVRLNNTLEFAKLKLSWLTLVCCLRASEAHLIQLHLHSTFVYSGKFILYFNYYTYSLYGTYGKLCNLLKCSQLIAWVSWVFLEKNHTHSCRLALSTGKFKILVESSAD